MILGVKHADERVDTAWRKSRLAARLLIRKEAGRMRHRDQVLARQLSQDPEVSNRLIEQALYFLGIGLRKNAFDRGSFARILPRAKATSNGMPTTVPESPAAQ
jgi:hypothetical protein